MAAIGVIGAGTMGSGIAIAFANAGHDAFLIDSSAQALARSREYAAENYESLRRKGRLDEAQINARLGRIHLGEDFAAVSNCSLIVEAVFESLQLKAEIFTGLARRCASDAILATNTSTLDIDAIAAGATSPERCIGMHFFSPAHIMKLVEIVRGRQTSQATIATVCSLTREIGKTPVVVGNCDGFVGNRMLLGFRREAELLVLQGARPRDVDSALEAFGFAMGPFAVSDLAGIDVGVRAKHERAARGEAPPFTLTRLPDELVAVGRLGKKTGHGYYRYDRDDSAPRDEVLDGIIAAERMRLGIAPRAVAATEIVERCVLALVNEGGRVLDDGIAASADDIDTIWRQGYGFPAARGGPMQYAAARGFRDVAARINEFAQSDAAFWKPASYLQERVALLNRSDLDDIG